MRKPFLAFLLLPLALTACGGGANPVGTWRLDAEAAGKMVESMMQEQMASVPAAQQAMMKQMTAQMVEGLKKSSGSIVLAADGTATVGEGEAGGSRRETKGTWKLDGDKLSITAVPLGKSAPETKTGTLAGDEIRIEEEAGGKKIALVFRRS
ncbi:MAG: hypothetical protein R3F56_24760 [Planctomycetota bacterium]